MDLITTSQFSQAKGGFPLSWSKCQYVFIIERDPVVFLRGILQGAASMFMFGRRWMLWTSLWRWRNRRGADSLHSGNYVPPPMVCVSGDEWGRRLFFLYKKSRKVSFEDFLKIQIEAKVWMPSAQMSILVVELQNLGEIWPGCHACGGPSWRTKLEFWA